MKEIGRNSPCPCWSGEKYKKCCLGAIPWQNIISSKSADPIRFLSTRGKNLLFINAIAEALQLDNTSPPKDWQQIKRACTPKAVKIIHESILEIWPNKEDLSRIFQLETNSTSGLYVGNYEPEIVLKGVTRHCLYSDSILLIDPFMDPRMLRPKFNPLEKPEEHIATTLKSIRLWFSLVPWVEAGLIKFIKSPGDFDYKLHIGCLELQRKKFENNPELKQIIEEQVTKITDSFIGDQFKEYYLLSHHDEAITSFFHETYPDKPESELEIFLDYLRKKREQHPYFVERPIGKHGSEFLAFTSGANYEMAKITSSLTGSHIITDLKSRWKEIEIDRKEFNVNDSQWQSFAKAFQGLDFKFLDNVPLDIALTLRQQNKLENIRSFLRKTWRSNLTENELDEVNAQSLADEMLHEINEAESEWAKIDQELMRWFGLEVAGAAVAGQQAIASGSGAFYGVGVALAGITNLAVSWHQRKHFFKRYPASFFLSLKN